MTPTAAGRIVGVMRMVRVMGMVPERRHRHVIGWKGQERWAGRGASDNGYLGTAQRRSSVRCLGGGGVRKGGGEGNAEGDEKRSLFHRTGP